MKKLITVLLIVCFLGCQTISANPPQPTGPQPKWCLVCCLIVIGIVVCGVMVYGLWKMCKNIPGGQPPPAPATNAPPIGAAAPVAVPPIQLEGGNNAALQISDDGKTWVTAATFTVNSDGTNMVITASDTNGVTLGVSTSPLYGGSGMPTALADFSKVNLALPKSDARLYRLVGTP